jgi:6-phosphogluconolactonase
MQLIIGAYTERLPHVNGTADGILSASFDPVAGVIGPVGTAARTRNPSYLALSASGRQLYAVLETESFGDHPGGGVAAYARDPGTGRLTPLNTVPSLGPAPCFVSVDRSGRFVLVANYGTDAGSVTVYATGPDGRLGDLTGHVPHAGSGPDPDRQAGPHAHMIVSDPVTGAVLVTDLGSDAVVAYQLDAAGRLTADGTGGLAAAPGSGPRHLAFHPGGEHLFLVSELDSTVCVLRRGRPGFAVASRVSTRAAGAAGPNLAAAVRVTPSGRHVLVSNRGDDSLAVYRFDAGTARLSLLGHAAAPGACPRDLVVTPAGRHVLVACQDGAVIASYPFDDARGVLGAPVSTPVPTPVCLLLAPLGP